MLPVNYSITHFSFQFKAHLAKGSFYSIIFLPWFQTVNVVLCRYKLIANRFRLTHRFGHAFVRLYLLSILSWLLQVNFTEHWPFYGATDTLFWSFNLAFKALIYWKQKTLKMRIQQMVMTSVWYINLLVWMS